MLDSGDSQVFTLTITDSSSGAYTFTLLDQLDHVADSNTEGLLDLNLGSAIVATDKDGDQITLGSTALLITVQDDIPTALAGLGVNVIENDPTYSSTSGALLGNDRAGTDVPATVKYFTLNGGSTQYATGSTTKTLYGNLVVSSDGSWSYEPDYQVTHTSGTGTNLSSVQEYFIYFIEDADGDTASARQNLIVQDTNPIIGTITPRTVDEKNLSSGSSPAVPVTAVESLQIQVNPDNIFDTKFLDDTVPPFSGHYALTTNGGLFITYYTSSDGHTIIASTSPDPVGSSDPATWVFTITINNFGSDITDEATYTFTLLKPLDHFPDYPFVKDDNNDGIREITLPFHIETVDGDGDKANAWFNVVVLDDSAYPVSLRLDEDSEKTMTINADATLLSVISLAGHGVTNVDLVAGTITYIPSANYSGTDKFTYSYTSAEDGTVVTQEVIVTVDPLSDAPVVQPSYPTATWEDQPIALGLLYGPTGLQVTDNTDKAPAVDTDDNPERLGAITLSGIPLGAKIFKSTDGTLVFEAPTDNASFTILLVQADGVTPITGTDGKSLFVNGTTADKLLTVADYEGLMILPPPDVAANFVVRMSVTEFEVDKDGKEVDAPDKSGKTSHTDVTVNVTAVTDRVDLQWSTPVTTPDEFGVAPDPLDEIRDTPQDGTLDKWIDEDTSFNLASLLPFNADDPLDHIGVITVGQNGSDYDGSERRWIVLTGLPGLPDFPEGITINGTKVTSGSYTTSVFYGSVIPDIIVQPAANFSGNISDITVTLYTQDRDTDSTTNPDGSDFAPLTKTDYVDLNLHVKPVASPDELVVADPAVSAEDTKEIKFLAGISVTDTSSSLLSGGIQTISSLTVKGILDGWTVLDPDGAVVTHAGGTFSVAPSFIDRYAEYSITPPAHSSADAALFLDIIVTDKNTDTGTSTYVLTNQPLAIELTPVAEKFVVNTPGAWGPTNTDQWTNSITTDEMRTGDSDGNIIKDDLRMNLGHTYSASASEGAAYILFEDGTFSLAADWFKADGITPFNEDTDETTTALFTPTVNGDASLTLMRGAEFSVDNFATSVVFNGAPVEIPISMLGSLQFKPPAYYSTNQPIKINVEAKTVDTDPDGGPAVTTISGLAVLTIPAGISPVDSLLSVNAYSPGGDEDTAIPLYIRPITNDVDGSEKSIVTITGIPDGATLRYDGDLVVLEYMSGSSGPQKCTIGSFTDPYDPAGSVSFNPDTSLTFTPPFNSNLDYTLTVTVTSKDTNGSATVTTTLPSVPIAINVRGVADGMVIHPVSPVPLYSEAAVDADTFGSVTPGVGDNRISLKNLIDLDALQTYLKDKDLSEVVKSEVATFKITLLDDKEHLYSSNVLSLTGTGVELIKGDGIDRIWSFSYADLTLGNVMVRLPEHYSGTVTFDLYPVTTENDGDSLTGVQDPYPATPIYNVPLHLSVVVVPENPGSIDGTMQLSTTVPEDTLTKVDFTFSKNGDTNETLDWVIIKSLSLAGQPFTLYYDHDEAEAILPISLDAAVAAGYIESDPLGYKVSGAALGKIYVQTAPDLPSPSVSTYAFDVQYQITDPATVSGSSDDVQSFDRSYTLTLTPVTDPVAVEEFLGATSKFTFLPANASVADTPDPDTGTVIGTVTATGSTIITLKVTVQQIDKPTEVVDPTVSPSPGNGTDVDGSEVQVRLLIDGVPDGVTVGLTVGGSFVPATYVGDVGTSSSPPYERINRWVLDVDQSFLATLGNSDGHVEIPLEFALNGTALDLQNRNDLITVTAESHDSVGIVVGDTVTASMSWRLITDGTFVRADLGILYQPTTDVPATIDSFIMDPLFTSLAEDTPVSLDLLLSYALTGGASPLSIVLTNPPVGAIITGMEEMTVGGVTFWTASVTPLTGETADDTLARLLQGISVTPPSNSNDNWIASPPPPNIFTLDLTLTAYGADGVENHKFAQADLRVEPRTDDTVLTITPENVAEDHTAPFTVTVKVGPDGNFTELTDGKLYLRLDDSLMDAGGVLYSDSMHTITVPTEVDPAGLENGVYYVVTVDLATIKTIAGQTLQFYYEPATNASGSVALTAFLKTHEIGDTAKSFRLTQKAASFTVAPINDGYPMTLADQDLADPAITVIGDENTKILIPVTSTGLDDTDNPAAGSEKVLNALLENVPVGYLVYAGMPTTLAENLGDDGTGKNMWRIPVASGATVLPAIYVEPPAYVSGTIHSLKLTVATSDKVVVNNPPSTLTFDLQVTPVANGFELLNPVLSFGNDGYVTDVTGSPTANQRPANRILLSLNAGMYDLDGSETVTISFTGIGDHASFYKSDGSILSSTVSPVDPYVSYNSGSDTYTLYHIPVYDSSPSNRFDVNNLYLVQSAGYVPGVQVSAWTVESANGDISSPAATGSFDLNIAAYEPTTGHDTLLYDGTTLPARSYDGLAGDDTLVLRKGEDIAFDDPTTARLRNIENIDLSVTGINAVSSLEASDVLAVTDARDALYILGSTGDSVELGSTLGFLSSGNETVNGNTYSMGKYTDDSATVYVQNGVTVTHLP